MPKRPLSNLELTFLGLTWLRGPCTIYSVMKELSLSASSYHKGRAGAAYSVSKRLIEFGFLEQSELDLVKVTVEGEAQLREWLTAPVPMADIAHSADLIRLRFFFLEVVELDQRVKFIDECIEGLQEFLKTCEGLLPKNEEIGDYYGVLATLSTIYETRARIEWLRTVRKWVLDPPGEGESWSAAVLGDIC
ncbi:MAG: hypothetical protein ACKVQS_06815 [Fimbriimonadaceae bacterium]